MSDKKNGNGFRLSPSFIGWLVVTLVLGGMAYGSLATTNTSTAETVKQIRVEDEKTAEKLEDVRERLVRVETRQEAQGVTLDRIDRTIQEMAKPK